MHSTRNLKSNVKILHFITSLKIGGAETALYNLLEYWTERRENDHAVLYIHGGPYEKRIRALGIPVYQLKGLVSPYDFVAWRRLKKIIARVRPDVIHSALWSANVMSRIVSRSSGIPLVCDLHGDCKHYGAMRNFFTKCSQRFGDSKAIVAVSSAVRKSFIEIIGGEENVQLIRNGVSVDKIRERGGEQILLRQKLGVSDDDFVIGSVGRLNKIKRYDLLIDALARCVKAGKKEAVAPNMVLILVGDGPERDALTSCAKSLSVEQKVIFVGEQENPYPFYKLFDCFALSSQTEGLSIALLEALAFGLPIVTTNEKKEHDVIVDGVNGFVIPVARGDNYNHNVNDLSTAFEKLYFDDRIVNSMRDENFYLVAEHFCLDKVACQYEKIYKKFSH